MDKSESHETRDHEGESQAGSDAEQNLTAGQAIRAIRRIAGISVSRSTLWRWHMEGRLRSVRVGRRLFTTERDIRLMLREDSAGNRAGTGDRGAASALRLENGTS